MTDLFQPARDAERLQRERFHVQQSLTDDLPVLIPAFPLPGVTFGGSDLPFGAPPGSSFHDNAADAQSLSGTRAPAAEGA